MEEDSWFFPCVTAVAGLLPGDAGGTFRPYDAITLSEFVSAICRGTGCRLPQGSAADVLPDAAVHYAALFGWIDGTASGDQNVTRAQAVQILNRALGRTPWSKSDLLPGMKAVYGDLHADLTREAAEIQAMISAYK